MQVRSLPPQLVGLLARSPPLVSSSAKATPVCHPPDVGVGVTGVACVEQRWLDIRFNDAGRLFSDDEKRNISGIIGTAAAEVCRLLPTLRQNLKVTVTPLEHDLAIVAGVTGSAGSSDSVEFKLSTVSPGGAVGAANAGLRLRREGRSAAGSLPRRYYEGMADVFAID